VTKTGSGSLTFTGNNTYSGGTVVSSGVLRLRDDAPCVLSQHFFDRELAF
jgi:autotransporter-associated beta strand protein